MAAFVEEVRQAIAGERDAVAKLRRLVRLHFRILEEHPELAEVVQVNVAGHELRERVYDRDDRLGKVAILHAGGAPESACAGHVAAKGGGA